MPMRLTLIMLAAAALTGCVGDTREWLPTPGAAIHVGGHVTLVFPLTADCHVGSVLTPPTFKVLGIGTGTLTVQDEGDLASGPVTAPAHCFAPYVLR